MSTGSLQTLNSGDRLTGGDGTDELIAVVNASVTPSSMSGIENLSISAITNAVTLDLTNATGVSSIVNQGSSTALTLSGVPTTAGVSIRDTAIAGQTVTYSSVAGTADTATITLQNVTGAATLIAGGIETLNLVTAGTTAQTLANLTDANTATLNISGTSALNVTLTGAAAVRTIDASTLAGVLTVTPTTTLGATVTGGAGNDAITLNRVVADSVAGGAGNDTITFTGAGTLDIIDSISGGDGVADTLVGNIADLVALTAATVALRTGFERITVSDALGGNTLTTANVQAGIERVNLATTGTGTVTMEAGDKTIGLTAATGALTVNDTGVAATDTLTITNGAAQTNVFAGVAYTINGFETVTLNTTGSGAATAQTAGAITLAGDSGTTTLNISGSNGLTTAIITAGVINASGLTGTAALTMVGTPVSVTSITGSLNADTLVGDASSSIDGGAGNDTITGGNGNDTILGGDGVDTITTNGGAGDNVNAGAGNDIVAATLTAGNTIAGGDGTDVLSLAALATATTASGVSGFETLLIAGGLGNQDMAVFLDNSTFTNLRAASGVVGFTNVGAGVTTVSTAAATTSVAVTRLVDSSSSSLSASVATGTILGTLTAANEETITLTSSSTGVATVSTLAAAQLQTLNLIGSGQVTVSAITNASTTATSLTVDGSTNTAGVSVNASTSSSAASMTGSTAASNTLIGTGGADTIVGGGAADAIHGGAGYDVLTGGSGADTFTFYSTANGTPTALLFDTITDYTSGSDVIALTTTDAATNVSITQGTNTTAVAAAGHAAAASGVVSFHISDNTLALRLIAVNDALDDINDDGGATDAIAGEALVFGFGSDSYIFISDGVVGITSGDTLIKLTGVANSTSTNSLTIDGNGDITALA